MNENETPTKERNSEQTESPQNTEKKETSFGATIASIIIILIIVVGAFYFFSKVEVAQTTKQNQNSSAQQQDSANAIEADLQAQNFDDLDEEMNQIEAEFEAEVN
jgi:uncharacterized protein HemX